MPKNKFEDVIFTAVMAIVMVLSLIHICGTGAEGEIPEWSSARNSVS